MRSLVQGYDERKSCTGISGRGCPLTAHLDFRNPLSKSKILFGDEILGCGGDSDCVACETRECCLDGFSEHASSSSQQTILHVVYTRCIGKDIHQITVYRVI